jgi:predicted nucleic acid-binding protein
LILVDTSVWIEVFRSRNPLDLDSIVDFDEIVTCLPVVQELLQGFRDEGAFRTARESLFALPLVESPVTRDLVEEAVGLFRAARRQGLTVRSSVDCLIAACAIRNHLMLLHRDRDFDLLARVSPLQQRTV